MATDLNSLWESHPQQGVMHPIDAMTYNEVIRERDFARAQLDHVMREVQQLQGKIKALNERVTALEVE